MIGCRACNRTEKGAALEAAGEDMVREDWHCKWLVFSIGGGARNGTCLSSERSVCCRFDGFGVASAPVYVRRECFGSLLGLFGVFRLTYYS